MEYANVIIKPVISEKAALLTEKENVYAFYVHRDVNKCQIRDAVESLFSVRVESIRIVNDKPELIYRHGRKRGVRSATKKAYIRLMDGDSLSFYDGV